MFVRNFIKGAANLPRNLPRMSSTALRAFASKPVPIGADEFKVPAWGVFGKDEKHEPLWIPRGNVGDEHVKVEIIYSGICHTDCDFGANKFGITKWPFVAGHEMYGKVVEVGKSVTKFKLGDKIGVGCMVDSCLGCEMCKGGDEQYCMNLTTATDHGIRRHGRVPGNQKLQTFGGYSAFHVVHEHFGIKVADGIPEENIGPIMCAGATVYNPLKTYGALGDKKMKIGIVGVGGLGTMGIKLASAMGHEVVAFSTSPHKEEMAKEKGADEFCNTNDRMALRKYAYSCDLILSTISAPHDVMTYLNCLKKKAALVQMGIVTEPMKVNQVTMFKNQWILTGSHIGNIKDTEEALEFCAKHKIWPDVDVVEADKISWAWDQLNSKNADAKRYVIDVRKSLKNAEFMPKE